MIRWVVSGVVVGAVASVTPLELTGFGAALAGWALYRSVKTKGASAAMVLVGTTTLTIATAVQLPTKDIDRRQIELSSRCVPVKELTKAMRVQLDHLASEAGERPVCFDNLTPNWRTIAEQSKTQAGVDLTFHYCGSGATVLFGAYPVTVVLADRGHP
jgi:hypothetical protein